MKIKKIIALLLFCNVFILQAQNNVPNVSINISNQPITSVFEIIEQQTNYKFYYINDWFGAQTISANYTDIRVDQLLKNSLDKTDVNFFIKDTTYIYLTKNNLVYSTLPVGFFGENLKITISESVEDPLSAEDVSPLFTTKTVLNDNSKTRTVRIGKENATKSGKTAVLSGKVFNATNGKPVPELSIIVQGTTKGVSTDANGFYTIELPIGIHNITAKGLGFKDQNLKVIIYSDGTLDLTIEDSIEALDEVLIIGNVDRNIEEAITGVINIDIKELKTIPLVLGERDILKAALTLPGIANAGEGASGFNVRGGKTDQNLVLLDDGVIYNPSHFFGIFSAINPFSTGSATIYKGNIPAQFGGRLASVFDLKTKTPNNSEFSGEAAIGPVTSSVVLEIPIVKDKAGLLVGGRATYSDWILRSIDNEDISNSQASFFDMNAKYNHIIDDNNEIKATGYYSKDAFSITSDSIFGYSNRLASLRWNHRFNKKHSGSLIATNSQYAFNIEFDGESNNNFDLGYVNNESEVKFEFNYLHSDKHKFKYGLSNKLYQIDTGNIYPLVPDSET